MTEEYLSPLERMRQLVEKKRAEFTPEQLEELDAATKKALEELVENLSPEQKANLDRISSIGYIDMINGLQHHKLSSVHQEKGVTVEIIDPGKVTPQEGERAVAIMTRDSLDARITEPSDKGVIVRISDRDPADMTEEECERSFHALMNPNRHLDGEDKPARVLPNRSYGESEWSPTAAQLLLEEHRAKQPEYTKRGILRHYLDSTRVEYGYRNVLNASPASSTAEDGVVASATTAKLLSLLPVRPTKLRLKPFALKIYRPVKGRKYAVHGKRRAKSKAPTRKVQEFAFKNAF